MSDYTWEFTLDRLCEIRADHHAAMLGKQEIQRLVDHYLADYKRGITCAHCSCDMSKKQPHERCSNGGLCVSIEEFDQRKVRDMLVSLRTENNGFVSPEEAGIILCDKCLANGTREPSIGLASSPMILPATCARTAQKRL